MTEQVQTTEVTNQPTSATSAPATPASSEKMLRQSEVNEIAGRSKHEAYQKGKSEAIAEWQSQNASTAQAAPQATQMVGGIPQVSPEQLRAMIQEENQKSEQAKQYQGLANMFVSKMEAGKGKYQDFDKVVTPLNLPQIPMIWQTAAGFENPADIVYELGNNPAKLAQLVNLAYSPELVKREMQKLSDSLKQNEVAEEQKPANAPLSRPKPSNVGMGNGGNKDLSVSDWKKILRR
jgi:hypothetical protein